MYTTGNRDGSTSTARSLTVSLLVLAILCVGAISGGAGAWLGNQAGYTSGFHSGYREGGRLGFADGVAVSTMSAAAFEAAFASHVSNLIREGDSRSALQFLEGNVDSSFVVYSDFVDREDSEFGGAGLVPAARGAMKRAAEHRSTYPSESDDPETSRTIESVVAILSGTN